MHVIATAGHVDHGKSTLVRALTGMEPDRFEEERRRGMTIDLGYAWCRLPSGADLAFVDVPGHERFVGNMLAGAGPVPAVLLVVAADSGWARQTAEHVAAVDAFGVRHGVLAVTRCDLADPAATIAEVHEQLRATGLAGIATMAVSATTGQGLDDLSAALDRLVAALPPPSPAAPVRLWVDRCFTVRGSGTVITGTLPEGTIRQGDDLELRGRRVRIRGIQSLGAPVTAVSGTARVALNLRGVEVGEIRRGDALVSPGDWQLTTVFDAVSDATPPAMPMVHAGSAAVAARSRPLGSDGDHTLVRLTLRQPLPLHSGDRLVLRDPGSRRLSAATVLDPAPPDLRRRGAARRRAVALSGTGTAPSLEREVERRQVISCELLHRIGVEDEHDVPGVVTSGRWRIAEQRWRRWLAALADLAARDGGPLQDAGTPAGEVVAALKLPDPALLGALIEASPEVELQGGRVRPRGASSALRPEVRAAVEALSAALRERPFAAPEQTQLSALGLVGQRLGAAAAAGAILRLPGDVVLLPDAPRRAAALLAGLPQPFTLSAARQALDTPRRVAVPLLEHLDRLGVTERSAEGLRRLRIATPAPPSRDASVLAPEPARS